MMAECFARDMNREKIDFISLASMTPPQLNPIAYEVMKESGKDMSTLLMLSLLDIEPFMVDLTITLGDFDQSCLPNLPGMPPYIHWDVPDPSKKEKIMVKISDEQADKNLNRVVKLCYEMLEHADHGDKTRYDDGCGVVYGTLRDAACKIRSMAEKELSQHVVNKKKY